jgi:hypothetical protein
MNGSTIKGQAHGFHLNTLLKLKLKYQTTSNGKGNGGSGGSGRKKRHLLHFVIEQSMSLFLAEAEAAPDVQKEGEGIDKAPPKSISKLKPFYEDWKMMWNAGKISYHQLVHSFEESENLLRFCEKEYQEMLELKEEMEEERRRKKLEEQVRAEEGDKRTEEKKDDVDEKREDGDEDELGEKKEEGGSKLDEGTREQSDQLDNSPELGGIEESGLTAGREGPYEETAEDVTIKSIDILLQKLGFFFSLSPSYCISLTQALLGTFISSSAELLEELRGQLERTTRSVNAVKRFYGEFLLGVTSTQSPGTGTDEDPWSSFFSLLISFAEIYRTSLQELEEWKKSEEKYKESLLINAVQRFKIAPRKKQVIQDKDDQTLESTEHSKKLNQPHVTREDVFSYFKNQLSLIRKRNAASQLEASDSESEDEDIC